MDNKTLKQTFVYEPRGMLRKVKNARKPYPWHKAGSKLQYLITGSGKETYYLHRLIWQFHTGKVPKMIDHINGNTSDNRIENLRECTNAQNQYNSKRKSNNRSGCKGVVMHRNCVIKKWQAKIVVANKTISLGYFATKREAAEAYARAARRYAGEFARPHSKS